VPEPTEGSFTRFFLAGMIVRIAVLGLAMLIAAGGVALGSATGASWAPFLVGCAGLAVGLWTARQILRRWDPLNRAPATSTGVPVDPKA
jgi:hypothetical protein